MNEYSSGNAIRKLISRMQTNARIVHRRLHDCSPAILAILIFTVTALTTVLCASNGDKLSNRRGSNADEIYL